MKKVWAVTLLTLLLFLNVAITGCFEEEVVKEKPIKLELVGKSHKIYAGESTTYIILVKNDRDENDTITLSVASKPTGWDANLNLTTFNLTKRASLGIFLVVNASQDASKGDYKIKIETISDLDGAKNSKSITTKVIEGGEKVREGDKVEMDYIGYLTDFTVFDTTIEDIGKESAVRKAPSFQPRPSYEPLKVYVGPTDPDTTDEYISVVEGFWEPIVDMRVGQSRTWAIPPSKAYGDFVNATLNVIENVPMLETMSLDEFDADYPDEKPIEGVVMWHYFWGWNVSIDYVNETEDVVRIINEPYLNQTIGPYGWGSEVIYKNQSDNGGEGRIRVRHDAEVGMQAVYQNHSAEVKAIENDQIELEYNISTHVLGNEILIFDITLVDIPD